MSEKNTALNHYKTHFPLDKKSKCDAWKGDWFHGRTLCGRFADTGLKMSGDINIINCKSCLSIMSAVV